MLAAVNAYGQSVVLAGPNARMTALSLKKTPYFCPQCGRPVVIKAGDVNIPHFAHEANSSCDSFSEPESPRHLSGKLDLFNWIASTRDAEMEARLPDRSQRPDILTGTIAVEYQCSAITSSLFRSRTERYNNRLLTPFWLYGGPPIEKKGRYIKLTPFQRLFLRYHSQLGFYFITYYPESKLFSVYGRIIPVTTSLCFAERLDVRISEMPFPPAAVFSSNFTFSLQAFFDEKRKWIDRSRHYNNARTHLLFKSIYEAGRNPHLLPEEIGLPVRTGVAIRNHPVEWQFYIINDQKSGSPEEAAAIVRKRIESGHLKEAILPLAPLMTPEQAAADYIELINELGTGKRADSRSMGAKIQREETFCTAYEKQIIDRLIF
ncbi:competence protein CoiA [Domibacillus epiphyticus]|uniref:Competence protein CoiA n=1 Tax=Domibacillus epiphyticus TaxID=1714355 RepID=A0A1V2A8E8_9BACI|nr:competence protein CoiA family protein [Domibacillus epiphyticus]OMP67094.1 hypothetical protein BTO28_08930 [Domibacillus epiphyticus]